MKEIWKDIKGYEKLYQISNIGRVKSLDRILKCRVKNKITHNRKRLGKILKPRINHKGYICYVLCKNGKCKSYIAHRIVAIHFLSNSYNKPEVNHKDGNKQNNKVSNLEWCTTQENVQHSFKIGKSKVQSGRKNNFYKGDILVFDKNNNHIETLKGAKDMIKKNYTTSAVYACINGRLNSHKNCTFRRVK